MTTQAMNCINRVTLLGYLGKDPEIKKFPSGKTTTLLYLATSEAFQDKSGVWEKHTEWHTLVLWEKLALWAGKNLKKGHRTYAEGKIKTRTYIVPGEGKKFVREIIVDRIFSLEKKESSAKKEDELPW